MFIPDDATPREAQEIAAEQRQLAAAARRRAQIEQMCEHAEILRTA